MRRAGALLAAVTVAALWALPASAADWTFISAGTGLTLSYRPPVLHGAKPNLVRIWVRWDYAAAQSIPNAFPATTYLSAVGLEEVDCTETRARDLQYTYYAQSNMAGFGTSYSAPEPAWRYEIPGTMGDQIIQLACQLRGTR